MDVSEYRSARTFNTEGVFVTLNANTEMGGLFMRLNETHVWFLEAYGGTYTPNRVTWRQRPGSVILTRQVLVSLVSL